MSEAIVVEAGTIASPITTPPASHPKYLRAHFDLRTTPKMRDEDDEPFVMPVVAYGPLCTDVLDKLDQGDRVIVQGRLRSFNGAITLTAVLIGLDLRSVDEHRSSAAAFEAALA
ncbi:MAG: single-stranded DNA-binding protein [Phycicoccus sp.]